MNYTHGINSITKQRFDSPLMVRPCSDQSGYGNILDQERDTGGGRSRRSSGHSSTNSLSSFGSFGPSEIANAEALCGSCNEWVQVEIQTGGQTPNTQQRPVDVSPSFELTIKENNTAGYNAFDAGCDINGGGAGGRGGSRVDRFELLDNEQTLTRKGWLTWNKHAQKCFIGKYRNQRRK